MAFSSTEVEYMASTNATKETLWHQRLCKDIGFNQVKPTTIFCDNQNCIALTQILSSMQEQSTWKFNITS